MLVVLSTASCSKPKVAPVQGRVTLDGKPLANVHVSFQPIAKAGKMAAGSGSYALTDADGKYALLLVHGEQPGAFIGTHHVAITAKGEAPPDNVDFARRPPPKVVVPAKYGANGDLSFEVPPGGTSAADFELTSRP